MINFLSGEVAKVQDLVKAGMVLIGIGFIAHQWITKKALVPVLGALLLAGVTNFAAFNTAWFHNAIKSETTSVPASQVKATP